MNNISPSFTGLRIRNAEILKSDHKDIYSAIKENKYLNKLAQSNDVVVSHTSQIEQKFGNMIDSLEILIKEKTRKLSNFFIKKTLKSYYIDSNAYQNPTKTSKDIIKRLAIIDREQSFKNPEIFENNLMDIYS